MKKILVRNIILIMSVSVFLAGTIFFLSVYDVRRNRIEEEIRNCARLLRDAAGMREADDAAALAGRLVSAFSGTLADAGVRLTVLDLQGDVLADSEADSSAMENHLNRPEVQAALRDGEGTSSRMSTTIHLEMMYFALADPEAGLVIRTAKPTERTDLLLAETLAFMLPLALLALLLAWILVRRYQRMVAGEIDDLASGVIRLGKGDFTVRFERGGGGEMDRLRGAIDDAAEELGGRFDAMADHAAKLDAILDNTQNSIIGLDGHGNILLINNAARKRFNVRPGEEVRGHSLLKVVRNAQINGLVERSIRDKSRSETEIVFRQGDDDRILKVFVKPLDLEARVAGDLDTIVYINDVTELRNLEKVRTDFASNVTHELKTPLTSIRGFIETLKDGAIRDPAVASGFLDIIDIEAERLHALIQDVLYLSEIESGRKESDPGSCDVGAQIEEVVRLLDKEAEKYGVRVAKGPTEGVRVRANPDRIRQMLINLVGNAIKYNKPGGSVTVSCLRTAEGAVVSVKDTGIGIEKKHLGRIFERFYRVDAGRSRDVGGTGLGLAIVKHIAQLYGGAVRVESAPGEGSEFTVVFP